jgi:hypothetical protein
MTLRNAFSNASIVSSAPISRAVLINRSLCGFSSGFRFFAGITDQSSSNGNHNCRISSTDDTRIGIATVRPQLALDESISGYFVTKVWGVENG